MEARLVRCLLLALLGAYVESEVPVKIEKIQKITMSIPETKAVEDNTLICCKAIPEGADDITLTYIPEGTPEQNFKALTPIVDTNCIQFEVSLSSVSTESDTTFEIKFESSSTPGTSLGLAQAKLVVPDITKIRADLVGKTGEVIRVSGLSTSPDEWTISDSEKNKLTCKVLSLDATLCFILNDGSFTESDVLTTCATVPNTFDTSAGATVDVCNEGEDATLPTIGPETTAATLFYGDNNMAITISETSGATLYDVVFSHDGIIDINTGLNSVPPITASVTRYTPAVRDISIIVVGLDEPAVVESNSTNFRDYDLKVTAFGSTIEMEWTNADHVNIFSAALNSGNSPSFNDADVDCNDLENCYAYFINVDPSPTNRVQIQPYKDSEKNALNAIVSGDVAVSPSPTLDNSRDLLIQNINLDWSSDSLTVDVEVCFQHEDAADLAQYQLVLVDSKGHWVRVQGTSQKTDGILCFSGATLDTRQFTTANKVAVLVTKRDVDGRTVLASAESHIFFITPKVAEGVSGRGNIVSWRNPGGYKFTAKRAGRPAQITTNHGSLYYFHRRTTRPDDVLVVEAVVLNVKISAVVPLTHRETADEISNVIVNEIVLPKTEDTFDVCYQDPLEEVTYAEITVIEITTGPTKQTNMKAIRTDQCSTFNKLVLEVDSHIIFELRLYSGNDGNYIQIGKGSLDFMMQDFSNLAQMTSVNKVGDGKILRLSYDQAPQDTDKIITDDGTTLVVLGSSITKTTNIQYLILQDDITSSGLKVYREINGVTVNEGSSTTVLTVTRGTVNINDATKTKPEFKSVTLEHEPLTTTVEATTTASSDKFELVNYWMVNKAAGPVTVNVCEDLTSPALCNVVGYTPGSNTVNVLLVGYATADSNTMLESDVHTIQDYDIAGSFIFSQTTEWHWTLPSAATEYMATITEVTTKQDPTATFTTSTVTCNTPETFCYGYFLGLGATNQYTVMIQPKSGTGYNDLNKIVSGKVSSQRRILTNNTVLGDVTEVMVKEIVFGTGGTFDICYKDPLAGVTYAEITVVRINGDSAEESSVAATAVGSCTTFSTPAFGVNDHVVFELRLYSGQTGSYTQISKGSLDFTMPDFSNFALLTSVNKVGDGKILRLSYDEAPQDTDKIITDDGMTLVVVGSSVTKTTNIQYLILQDDITSSGLKVYREIEGVTVNDGPSTTVVTVTRGTVTINDATKIKPDLTSVTLEHEPLTTTVEATTTASSDKFELVNYWLEDEAAGTVTVNVCEDLTSPASCNVVGYTPGSNTVNVLLVGYAAAHLNTMLESDVHIIQDYDITGRFISSTITEWYWTMKSEDPEYNMIIQLDATNQDPPPTFTTSTVTCDATDTSCYGYFLGLGATNQYTVKIQPKTGTGYDPLNQIVSGKVSSSRTIVTNDSVLVEQQKGNAARISWRKPEDDAFTIRKDSVFPVVTSFTSDNLTSKQALGMDFGARLPRETQDSAVIVNGMIPVDIVSNDVPELTIKYITFSINLSPAGKEEKVLVELETAQDVTAATSLTLAFISSTDGTHQYSDTIDAKLMTKYTSVVAFDNMKDYAFSPGEVGVVVTGHNNAPVAYGLAQIILRDPKAIAYRVGKVGDSAHEAFRITYSPSAGDSGGVQLDYDNFCECHSSPCYCLGRERVAQEPRPFCLQLNNAAAATTEEFVLQCDDKLTATNADEEAQVTSVKMTHKKDTNTADVQVDVTYENTVELTIYESGTTSVNTPTGTCTLPSPGWCILSNQDISSDITNFNILLVTADKNDIVQKSNLLSFEDYKTKVTQLTSDAIEVRFSAKTKTLYQVTVTPDGGAYDTTTIECGAEDNNLCTVYFIAMTAGNNYEATVQLRTSGELNQVATQFVMETREKISRNATLAFRAKGSERLLDLCVGDQLPSTSGDYILVLIAGLNNTVITKGPLSNENPCFYDVSVDVQPSQHVNIMVLTDEENTRVVMETDVFILDQTSADISVTQVGSKALKATWSNRNLHDLEYEVGLDGVGHTVACKAQQECIEYIHLNSSEGNTTVTIKENNDGTVQVVSVEVSPVTITELTIASRSIQWDDRLRVCFDRLPTADAYELGLEKDDTHLQTNVHAQVDTHATLETCIVSADTVDVGAYVDLWMVVTAFEASGTIVASGESTWNTILLSSSRNVRAAIQNTTILASWYLLDDTSTIDNFQVILRSSDGDTAMLASNTQSAYTFTSQSYGTYTVCVKALKVVTTESTVDSEEVCSDIIVFSNNAGPTQNVHETEPKSTAKDSVLLTWQPPQGEENVSGYYVSWSNVNPSSKRSPRHRLPPQSLMRSHEELQQWVSGEGDADFVIVPATETSVEVKDLQEDAKYTFCVSSIVNDVMAQSPACSNTSLADFIPLSPPSLLNPSGGELQWTDNNTGDITYMVEWRSPSEDDHLEVSETSYHLQVAPGKWDVSVRALSADSCSDPNTTTVTIPGVPTSILQVGSKKMTVTWYEEPTPQDNNRYIVDIFQDTQPVDQCTLGCSGDASKGDCSCEFSLETIQPPVVLTVSVHMYSQESYDLNFTMMQISGMRPVATTIRSSSEVDVKWEAVENAKFYQLSLYENESLSVVRWAKQQALPLWVTLTEEDMMGNVFVVQACTDESHCGDATQMTILDQNTSGGSSVVGAVLGGVLGVTILACVIFFFVKRQQVKKKERKALNDQEMAPAEYIYDEWGARRLGQAPVATTLSNTS